MPQRKASFSPRSILASASTIALSVAVFYVAGALLERLQFANLSPRATEELVLVREHHELGDEGERVSQATFQFFSEQSTLNKRWGAYSRLPNEVVSQDGVDDLARVALVTPGLLEIFAVSVQPAIAASELTPGTVILSQKLSRKFYGEEGQPSGATLLVSGRSRPVGGALVDDIPLLPDVDLFILDELREATYSRGLRSLRYLDVVAAIPQGQIRAVQLELANLFQSLVSDYPDTHSGWRPVVLDLETTLRGPYRLATSAALAVALAVFLFGLVSAALILVAERLRDPGRIAIRCALGASPLRICRDMLPALLMIAGTGCAVGIASGLAGLQLLRGSTTVALLMHSVDDLSWVPPRTSCFLLAALIVFLLSLLWFHFQLGRKLTNGVLQSARFGPSTANLGTMLLGAQATLAALGLFSALVLSGFLAGQLSWNLDADIDGVTTAYLRVNQRDAVGRLELVRQAVNAVGDATHGSVATASILPLDPAQAVFELAGEDGIERGVSWVAISGEFFESLGIELVAGRGLTDSETWGDSRVLVLSKEAFNQTFTGEFRSGLAVTSSIDGETWDVVGVAQGSRAAGRASKTAGFPPVYAPLATSHLPFFYLVAKVDQSRHLSPLEFSSILTSLDDRYAVVDVKSMHEYVFSSYRPLITVWALFLCICVVTTIIVVLGFCSISKIEIGASRQAFALRQALGAAQSTVRREIVLRFLRPVVIGGVVGSVLAALASRYGAADILPSYSLGFYAATVSMSLFALIIICLGSIARPISRITSGASLASLFGSAGL